MEKFCQYRMESANCARNDDDSKDEITSITANNVTDRAPSVIEDDVGSDIHGSHLDLVPVREREINCIYTRKTTPEPMEIVDVYPRSGWAGDVCEGAREMTIAPRPSWRHEVDRYDLEGAHQCPRESPRFSEEGLETVVRRPRPQVALTRHEPHRDPKRPIEPENLRRGSVSTDCTDIGRQITQLAQRIESLGNISRVHGLNDLPRDCEPLCDCDCHCHPCQCSHPPHPTLPLPPQTSLAAARKIDKVDRLQKRQEQMQTRLADLAKKLSDSTRDLRVDTAMTEVEPVRTGKARGGKKGRRVAASGKSSSSSSSFLRNLVEAPLTSSSYCLQAGTASSSGTTDGALVAEELASIRREFRDQVDELRRLLSERYQARGETGAGLGPEIDRSLARVVQEPARVVQEPISLRNITNVFEEGPCPLDKYLAKRPLEEALPPLDSEGPASLRPGHLPSVARAIKGRQRMLSDPVEAERFLAEMCARRANLENNISGLERAKEARFLFAVLENLQGDEQAAEVGRVQAMVEDAISQAGEEVRAEVRREHQAWLEARRGRHEGEEPRPVPAKAPPARPAPLCRRYGAVAPRVDSGLARAPPSAPPPAPRIRTEDARPAWANRRRCRTPYLHFVNDLKLAKRAVAPLPERAPKTTSKRRQKEITRETNTHKRDDLVLIGVRQYSLDYQETDLEPCQPLAVAVATSPRTPSITPRPPTPTSPTMSEPGTGIHLMSRRVVRPREERVGPFSAIDPLDEERKLSQPVNLTYREPEERPRNPDINNLRWMIEKALYDQIEIPSPTTSTDVTLSVPKGLRISTPAASERDHYSEDFGPDTPRDKSDTSMTVMDGLRTPDMSRMSTDHEPNVRFETPSVSPTRSLRMSPKRQAYVPEKVSECVQTVSEKGNQTIEDKEMQTSSPVHTQTQRGPGEPARSEDSLSSSGLEASLSDTQVDSWSDGMWLLDRSEGEMAQHYLQPVARWNLGTCPDNPLWPRGTEDIARVERHSSQSFGEFERPTLPGLVPTADSVLQLKTLPFRPRPPPVALLDTAPASPDQFRLIRMSRDSRRTPGASFCSDGEVRLADSGEDDDEPRTPTTARNSGRWRQTQPEELMQSLGVRRSKDSRPGEDSYSAERVRVDPMRYLRASGQSQSDQSDTGGLMSTGQVIAAAFAGGDSVDFEAGPSEQQRAPPHRQGHHDTSRLQRGAVVVPTLASIDQSDDDDDGDLSEIILQ